MGVEGSAGKLPKSDLATLMADDLVGVWSGESNLSSATLFVAGPAPLAIAVSMMTP